MTKSKPKAELQPTQDQVKQLRDESTSPGLTTAATARATDSTGPRSNKRSFSPVVVCLQGPQRGLRLRLTQYETILGRSSTCHLALDDRMCSRRHTRIIYRNWDNAANPPDCYVEDLGSRNGTDLNSQPVEAPMRLNERDRISLGTTVLGFFLRDEEEQHYEKSQYERATRDSLTGLYNRYHFAMLTSHHMDRARRYQRPLALLLMEADDFEVVRNTYGADVADKCLIHLAGVIHSCARTSEIVARWSDNQFAVLLTESDLNSARALAERVRKTVILCPVVSDAYTVALTISVGGTQASPTETTEAMIKRVTTHLDMAQRIGTNCAILDPAEAASQQSADEADSNPTTSQKSGESPS